MTLDALNTFGTLTTVVIVAATAIAALIQLRHLRAGNQINALLTINDEFQAQAYRDANHLINHKLARMMEQTLFREYAASIARNMQPPDVNAEYVEVRRAAIFIGNIYEELGILIKHGIVDKALFFDRYSSTIVSMWERLTPFFAFIRVAAADRAIFENFELLVVTSQDWERDHPSTYPARVRRLELLNSWPVPPRIVTP